MQVSDALERGLERGLQVPTDPDAIVRDLYGGRNGELAAELAGTTDRRSRAFDAARKRVERWRKGAKPNAENRAALAAAARGRALRNKLNRLRTRGATAAITAWLRVSRDLRRRAARAYIAPAALGPTLDAAEAGNYDDAADAFEAAFFAAYGIGESAELEDVEALELDEGDVL